MVYPLRISGTPSGLSEKKNPKYYWNTTFPVDSINRHINSSFRIRGVKIQGSINLPDVVLTMNFESDISQNQLIFIRNEIENFTNEHAIYASEPKLIDSRKCIIHFDTYGLIPDFKSLINRIVKLDNLPKISEVQFS